MPSYFTQRLGRPSLTPVTAGQTSFPTDAEELKTQLQEARDILAQWAQAEIGWNNQRRLFKAMAENISDLIVIIDVQGKRIWTNNAYTQVLGYSADETSGTHFLGESHPDDHLAVTSLLDQAIKARETRAITWRMRQRAGSWIELEGRLVPVVEGVTPIASVIVIAHDVTEKKQLTEALDLATKSVTAGQIIDALVRDLDQTVTTAIGNLSIAKNLNGPQSALGTRLGEIERGLQHARDLLEQIGTVTGQGDPTLTRVSLERVVPEAVNNVIRGTLVRAEYLFALGLPELELEADTFSLALRNIVENSVQAMDRGVVRVSAEFLSAEQMSRHNQPSLKGGSYVHLAIQDQGHGMPERTLGRAFEAHFTTREGAQGLGLPTALSAVQRLGGTIAADSTPGVGTTVHVYLPAAAAREEGDDQAPGAKKRILLMDDEQMILDIISRMLTHLGYEVKTCLDGSQAIAAFTKGKNQGEPFDLVLMDLVVPHGVGGQDAVHTIRKIDPQARVIASSGHLDHPAMKEHRRYGFSACLEKPYKLERLQQVIQSVLEQGS